MKRVLLDENVSWRVESMLKGRGYEVESVARGPLRGRRDEDVFRRAVETRAMLVSRDHHFTNGIRFPPGETGGIIYLTRADLRSEEESILLERFIEGHGEEAYGGRLVFLGRTEVRIRP
jgi:predicted nuclease of predicted toxin-antitoxin system